MVVGVAGGMDGPDGGAFDSEYLAVEDGLLGLAGRVLVNGGGEMGV